MSWATMAFFVVVIICGVLAVIGGILFSTTRAMRLAPHGWLESLIRGIGCLLMLAVVVAGVTVAFFLALPVAVAVVVYFVGAGAWFNWEAEKWENKQEEDIRLLFRTLPGEKIAAACLWPIITMGIVRYPEGTVRWYMVTVWLAILVLGIFAR